MSVVGELLLSAALDALFGKLTSELWDFLRQEGLYSKIKKWEGKLRTMEEVLADAEEKQITKPGVKRWLDDLRDLAYDVEDMIDEFATEALRRNMKIQENPHQASTSKLRKFLPGAVKFNKSMKSTIKDVSSRLEELFARREELGLKEITGGTESSSTVQRDSWRETTYLRTEPAIYGRDKDKDRFIQMMMKEEEGDARFRVTAIVGMGGLGKTTLAREVYNDARMEGFQPRGWVCISEDFDVLRISKAILESMTNSSCEDNNLNVVQTKLTEVVAGKMFMLVLDDVWHNDYKQWRNLMSPFKLAAPGSKVIVTTRLEDVVKMMNPNPGEFYELELLSEEACWSIFESHVGRDISQYNEIEWIRGKVIKHCKGLPLASMILGGILRCKDSEDEWLRLLNSNLLHGQGDINAV